MKYSLGIPNFLEEISSLSHSIIFLYFFALIPEEVFLITPCYSLELCIQMGISFLFSLPLVSFLFSVICKASSDNHFAFLHFFFMGHCSPVAYRAPPDLGSSSFSVLYFCFFILKFWIKHNNLSPEKSLLLIFLCKFIA